MHSFEPGSRRGPDSEGPPAGNPTPSITADSHDGPGRGAGRTRVSFQDWIPLAVILAAALVCHASALRAPFFADDYLFLEQVRGRSLVAALASPDPIGNFLRPVGRPLHFWLVTQLGGERPEVFHAVNLFLFLAAIALLYVLVSRIGGVRAATVAAAFVGLHYAADVPVLWCAGSQDLLALTFGLTAILLHMGGRRWNAALAFALAVLSKEVACVVPLIAMIADRRAGEPLLAPLRRAGVLIATAAAWAVVWIATARLRPVASQMMAPDWSAVPASLAHLLQVGLGLELPSRVVATDLRPSSLLALALAIAAVGWVFARTPARGERRSPAIPLGLSWGALAALPVAAVASIWSAYFYLFALCGLGLALGGWLANRSVSIAVLVVGLLAGTSTMTRGLGEFADRNGSWTARSHVNRFYLVRGMDRVTRYTAQLRSLRPALPPKSTVFFANLPGFAGFQIGDGALLRHVYRDTTLRSHYMGAFSIEKAGRGPLFFMAVENDSLRDHSADPLLLPSFAYSLILDGKTGPAEEALALRIRNAPRDLESRYWLAWLRWARGERAEAQRLLVEAGHTPAPGPAPEMERAEAAIAAGDTSSAIRLLMEARRHHALDVAVHSRLAALCLASPERRPLGVIETCAVLALAPDRADGWRKLAAGQLAERHYGPAALSLDRYFRHGGAKALEDVEAKAVLAELRRVVPPEQIAAGAEDDR